ncbi:type II secretion system F family protein [Bengtsoniella intestinalis]|uniref:type II secretion system F family protein n=1 Tax=Bengtsoniella intestinalis TaxID=3073143 RepID=UPI00391FC179
MPNYSYKGKRLDNKAVKGTISATSPNDCYTKLREQDIFALTVREVGAKKADLYRLKTMELADFCRQIGTMQSAGITIIKAVEILRDRTSKRSLLGVYNQLHALISQGNTITAAMEQSNGPFPELLINMFKSGEANGQLDEVAIKMATYYEHEHHVNVKIRNATAYPSVLAFITVAITIGLFTLVLPQMFTLIENSGAELSLLTVIIFGISQFILSYWPICAIGVAALVCLVLYFIHMRRMAFDHMKITMPKIGRLLIIIYTSRFARTMSSLYSSGVSMLDAVEMSAKTIGNKYIEAQFGEVAQKIRSGQPLSRSVDGADGVDSKLVSSIYIGEETGRLDQMLNAISEEYDYEASAAIDRIISYLEPIMIIIMGLVIGTVIVAIMLPMMQMYTAF